MTGLIIILLVNPVGKRNKQIKDVFDLKDGNVVDTDAFTLNLLNKHEQGPKFTCLKGDDWIALIKIGTFIKELFVFSYNKDVDTLLLRNKVIVKAESNGISRKKITKLVASATWK